MILPHSIYIEWYGPGMPGPRVYGGHSGGWSAAGGTYPAPTRRQRADEQRP